ncbi:MAG TPA: hypothetical protein DER07_01025, partial [Armatimonadetes bacterium]|nr:hypothetical protein [Armatimonadota bacterium]
MGWILNLKTSTKLALGFGVVLALMVAMAAVAIRGASRNESVVRTLRDEALAGVSDAKQAYAEILRFRMRHYRVLINDKPEEIRKGLQEIEEAKKPVEEHLASYEKSIVTEEDRKNFGAAKKAWEGYLEVDKGFLDLVAAGKKAEASVYIESKNRDHAQNVLEPALDKLVAYNEKLAETRSKEALAAAAALRTQMLGLGLAAALIAIVVATFLGRTVGGATRVLSEQLTKMYNGCVQDLRQALEALGRGDLSVPAKVHTQPLDVRTNDDLGHMMRTCNELREAIGKAIDGYNESRRNLAAMVEQLRAAALQVEETSGALSAATEQSGRASTEIAQGSERLATSAGEAASIVERLERSVQEVKGASESQASQVRGADAQLKQATEAIGQVASAAQTAAAFAGEGRRRVEEIVVANQRINHQVEASASQVRELDEASQQIGAIVQSIEQIAEQTNLLALNAAIEA